MINSPSTSAALSPIGLLSFAAVYVVWGSTYLGIRYAIETLPPWGMATIRFMIAAIIMLGLAQLRDEQRLTRYEYRIAAISGLFLVMANGIVCVIEQWVPSGTVAVVLGAMPIWILLLGWLFFGQTRPSGRKVAGAIIGLSGIAAITGGNIVPVASATARYGTIILIGSSALWAIGSLLQRKTPNVKSAFRYSAIQMASGTVLTALMSLLFEKPWSFAWSQVSATSLWALAYLIVFGSVVAFTAYAWLARNVEPHLVSTYAFVNPLIAVALGYFFFTEPVTSRFLLATLLVLAGLALLMWQRRAPVRPQL